MTSTLHFNVTTEGPTLGENVASTTPLMPCDGKSNFS